MTMDYFISIILSASFGKSAVNAMKGLISFLVYIYPGEKEGLTGK